MTQKLILLLTCCCLTLSTWAQDSNILNYIQKFKSLAISEQIRSGVPAAITLAQGIYETGAGTSKLCTQAHNHFGIKCKKNWKGQTYRHDDDRPNECFRKYENARQSYLDHSNFLKNNPRYKRLFTYKMTNYKKWAKGLLACGYATNKKYAQKLISYIEKYNLQQYTLIGINDKQFVAKKGQEIKQKQNGSLSLIQEQNKTNNTDSTPSENQHSNSLTTWPTVNWDTVQFYFTTHKNGLKGFYAPKGDLLLEYAIKHKVRYTKLLQLNSLPDKPLNNNTFIYLEKKNKKATHPYFQVKKGMTIHQISQITGVDINQIRLLNHLKTGEEPAAGVWIHLNLPAKNKPKLAQSNNSNKPQTKTTNTQTKQNPKTQKEYIYINHKTTNKITQKPTNPKPEIKPNITPKITPKTQNKTAQNTPTNTPVNTPINTPKTTTTTNTEPNIKKTLTPLQKLRSKMDNYVYGSQTPTAKPTQKNTNKPTNKTGKKTSNTKPKTSPTTKLRTYMQTVKKENKQQSYTTLPPSQSKNATPKTNQKTPHPTPYYTVQRGDTAFGIAKKFGITLSQLKKWNHLPASMTVQIGEKLRIAP